MVMLNKEYMINHMRNENGSINIKNVVLAAACEVPVPDCNGQQLYRLEPFC